MEKINIKNTKRLNVIGNLYNVSSDTIIIMAHGFTNDKSSNGRFDSMAEALNIKGYDALAIDFSGCGESDNADITFENQVDDLNSAIDYAISKNYKKIGLFGNSFGTLVCLKCFRDEVITMILVGALTDSMQYDWNEYFSEAKMNKLSRDGYFFEGDRKHRITNQTLKDYEEINQEKLLAEVDCPLLIIHGNNCDDKEELLLLEKSKKAVDIISGYTEIEIIEGGKHGLRNHWDQVIEVTINWYNKYL